MHHFDADSSFALGRSVRYFSADLGDWVTATIHSFNADGTMNLINRRVEADKAVIRKPQV